MQEQTVHFDIGGDDEIDMTVIYDISHEECQSEQMHGDVAEDASQNSNSRGARPPSAGESWPSDQVEQLTQDEQSNLVSLGDPWAQTTEKTWIQTMQDKYQAWIEQDGDWRRFIEQNSRRNYSITSRSSK